MFVQANEKFPLELLAKVLLELYWSFSIYDPQRGNGLRRTVTACCLVCRRWNLVTRRTMNRFFIPMYGKEGSIPLLSWYILRRPPLPQAGGDKSNQEGDPGWLSENYTEALSKSLPKFLPDLLPNLILGISVYVEKRVTGNGYEWREEEGSVVQSTLAACCLVSHEWNRIFTPILYANIFLGRTKSLLSRSLLHRTLRHTKPIHKALVRTITIEPAEDGSTANLLSICFNFSFPNFHKLILDFEGIDPAKLHPNFARNIRSLSKSCIVQMRRGNDESISTDWKSFWRWIGFIRYSKSTPCSFEMVSSRCGYFNGSIFLTYSINSPPQIQSSTR